MADQIRDIRERFPEHTTHQGYVEQMEQSSTDIMLLRSLMNQSIEHMNDKHSQLLTRMDETKEQFTTELMILEKKLKREDADLHSRIDTLSEYVRDVESRVDSMKGKDSSFEGLLMALVELARIDITLMEGDEEDKRTISLMGVREDT